MRAAVDVGGIEEVNASVECGIHHFRGARLIEPDPEVVAAESDERNRKRANASFFHTPISENEARRPRLNSPRACRRRSLAVHPKGTTRDFPGRSRKRAARTRG